MKLDCIEGSGQRDYSLWVIVDRDNGKEFADGPTVADAWHMAAMRLQKRVNDAKVILDAN